MDGLQVNAGRPIGAVQASNGYAGLCGSVLAPENFSGVTGARRRSARNPAGCCLGGHEQPAGVPDHPVMISWVARNCVRSRISEVRLAASVAVASVSEPSTVPITAVRSLIVLSAAALP